MTNARHLRKEKFLARYKVDDRMLRAEPKSGRPAILDAVERQTGDRFIIKEWRRDKRRDQGDLRELWHHEIRQLHRLAAYHGARENIVLLHEAGEDDDGYYVVLNPGQRSPLKTILDAARSPWLSHLRLERNRIRLWSNLKRIGNGLEILHSQGILHRNLDEWAIFTSGGEEDDFQLSGFEWTLRLTGTAPLRAAGKSGRQLFPAEAVFSFAEDWLALGKLAARLLGVDVQAFTDPLRNGGRDTAEHLTGPERSLLRLLLRPDPLETVDGEIFLQRIEGALRTLGSVASNREAKLHLACRLGRQSKLSEAIRNASGKIIEIDDLDSQLTFIESDLSDEPHLAVSQGPEPVREVRYMLFGRNLYYRLSQLAPRGRQPTWDIAVTESTWKYLPAQHEVVSETPLAIPIEIMLHSDAEKKVVFLQGRTARWDEYMSEAVAEKDDDDIWEKYLALTLLQLIEMLFIAATAFPVKLINQKETKDGVHLTLAARSDITREGLCEALGLTSPRRLMEQIFGDERADADRQWKLTEAGMLGESGKDGALWRFVQIKQEAGQDPLFLFEGPGPSPIADDLFLRPEDFAGQDRLLRRRLKSLRTLSDHVELLGMLTDPRRAVRPTHEEFKEDQEFDALDPSKREALKELWGVLPLYLVQGPPGVGKTRLVRELVARRFNDDPTTRMLLTAQSHQAVNHLMMEVGKVFANANEDIPLIVRCRQKDGDAAPTEFDVHEQARKILDQLIGSELLVGIQDSDVRQKLSEVRRTFAAQDEDDEDVGSARPDKAFEALLLRSANVVFSSTNSGDLERLIEERAQFDWTIVEEAAKASGIELIPPLLLSHRRLMIGDHHQLPPFGERQMLEILGAPEKVLEAIKFGRDLVQRLFGQASMEDVLEDIQTATNLPKLCGEAARALNLFGHMVNDEFQGRDPSRRRQSIAKQLLHQHRMHPAIAKLVSETFYDGALKTDEGCEERFKNEPAPFRISGSAIPSSPIVFINMPFLQSQKGLKKVEQLPRYHNPSEVDAVIEVLKTLSASPSTKEKPTLAVLSPYRAQVTRLHSRIEDARTSTLMNLDEFDCAGDAGRFVGTVDSFQGSEADIVVVSLVRNNHHSGIGGLGFLSDARRMNVLLSRAKRKLVIVGSLDFLRGRLSNRSDISQGSEMEFLHKMLNSLDKLSSSLGEGKIPLASIVQADALLGEV